MAGVANIMGVILKKIHWGARQRFVRSARPVFALSLLAIGAAGCSSTKHYVREKSEADFVSTNFAGLRASLVRVAVMPPEPNIARQRFWRERKASPKEIAAVSAQLQKLVETQLRYAGFTVQTPSTNGLTPAEAREQMDKWLKNVTLADSPESLGPTAKVLADAAHADALVFVRYTRTKTTWQRRIRGYHTTTASIVGAVAGAGGVLAGFYYSQPNGISGEGAAGLVLLGGAAGYYLFKETSWLITGGGDPDAEGLPNRAALNVTMVDGATGEVLWANSAVVESGDKNLESMTASVFRNFLR